MQKEKEHVNRLAYKLADDLSRLVIQEHKLFQLELKQISNLADDAVQELCSTSVKLQRSTDSIINAHKKHKHKTFDKADENLQLLSDHVHAATQETIRVLQFEDILKQLTRHALNRADNMDALFSLISNELANMQKSDDSPEGIARSMEKMRGHFDTMHKQIGQYITALSKDNPVKQDSMKTGKIEIF